MNAAIEILKENLKRFKKMTRDEEILKKIGCVDGIRAVDAEPNLESIWHDASEKPHAKEWLLIQFGEDDYDALSLDDLYIDMWCTWCKTYNVIRWAYISDLLPKQFRNSKQEKGGEK